MCEGMKLTIETEREIDGRWMAEVIELPGVMVYGTDERDAVMKVKALALRVIADKIEHQEPIPDGAEELFAAA